MIIYSVMPMELIFQNEKESDYQQVELQVGSVTMLVQPIDMNQARIVRLISPNPQDYLNPTYAPGQKIFFRPNLST
ncbi:MAG TPA: hypothetical protein DDY49_04570 [Paenibacillaceae bacterium]|nr:hypothetical protein [Paenibacillaceae bacterium]